MKCFICGTRLGNMEVHSEEVCRKQQKTNESNLMKNGIIRSFCPWCGGKTGMHENNCPNR